MSSPKQSGAYLMSAVSSENRPVELTMIKQEVLTSGTISKPNAKLHTPTILRHDSAVFDLQRQEDTVGKWLEASPNVF
ncbi:hypothetical protein AC579_2074 [Pseudocercospora musae]|uniref:Uncharacterized protein n=1 Tax=Pseudocercospora musae TaxID=113226 RepID=A0A139GUW4_9PEZI|nr:hypothetical protein AC579_2074 [Pseudocercospora musae]